MKPFKVCSLAVLVFSVAGCINLRAPRDIVIDTDIGGRRPVDTSALPPLNSMDEARQRLAEAYQRIDYLEHKVAGLKRDVDELEDEKDELEDQVDRLEDRLDR